MNINKKSYKHSGFTLIELLTVIAIIGILAGILIPTIGLVRKNAAKAKASSDLRQIAIAYNAFSNGGPRVRNISAGAHGFGGTTTNNIEGWAFVLAEFGGFNEAAGYFIESAADVAALATIPQTIVDFAATPVAATALWTAATGTGALSYKAAIGIPPNSRGPITPLIWTKGNGAGATADQSTWDIDNPWEGEGGHIAFLDSHVAFYNTLTGQLQDATGVAVDDVDAALPAGATVTAP